jgi:2-methylcitrate dehydratase
MTLDTAARDAACVCLLDALASAFAAVRDPACVRLLGPVVPGATMVGGARVPGTSYELDPVKAAFDVALAFGERQPGPSEAQLPLVVEVELPDGRSGQGGAAAPVPSPRDLLGGLLAVADWESRRRAALGRPPFAVLDLLGVFAHAYELQAALSRELGTQANLASVRAATAAAVVSLLNGPGPRLAAAVGFALLDGTRGAEAAVPCARWLAADASSRGVRFALLALAGEQQGPALPPAVATLLEHFHARRDAPDFPDVPDVPALLRTVRASLQSAQRAFDASATAHFPARQAAALQASIADPARLAAMPVHEFVSATVRA